MLNPLDQETGLARPHFDGSRVLFEIADGDRRVQCAISRGALQDLSQRRHFKAAELLLCFVSARPQIEAIALRKLRARAGNLSGTLGIWADDITDLPPGSTPLQTAAGPNDDAGRGDQQISIKQP